MLTENEFFGFPKSLTSFVKDTDVQAAILELIHLPIDAIKDQPVKAEPKTKRYAVTGTAFELFIACRLYREFKKKCLNKIDFKIYNDCAKDNVIWKKAWKIARKDLESYINKEIDADDNFFKALIVAANLMCFYRSGYPPTDISQAGIDEIQDLKNMMEIIPWDKFKPKKYIYLNPIFKYHDSNVLGADGDLIIDDVLIDIKAVQKNNNKILWCQLSGYYQLYHGRGLKASNAIKGKVHISFLGVYFARHGILQTVDSWKLFKSPAEIEAGGKPMKYVSSIFFE